MFRSFFFPAEAMSGISLPRGKPRDSLNPRRNRYRFIILGAGIHGSYLANLLLGELGLAEEELLLVDREEQPLDLWRRYTGATGMTHLRSTSVHHLDPEPTSLRSYLNRRRERYPEPYASPYNRPALALFNDHARWSLKRSGALGRYFRGELEGIDPLPGGYSLSLRDGSRIAGDNLILAPGQGGLNLPPWAAELPEERRAHLFSREYRPDSWRSAAAAGEEVAVVGAGISAVQAALHIAEVSLRPLTILSLHEPRTHQFDSDPGWIGPRYLARFAALPDPAERRRLLKEVRYPGSGDPALMERLAEYRGSGRIRFVSGPAREIEAAGRGFMQRKGARILFATGFSGEVPAGALISNLAATLKLPTGPAGYPVVNPYLAWAPGLFVSGALAELEIGPVARNISGARRSGERLHRLLTTTEAEI